MRVLIGIYAAVAAAIFAGLALLTLYVLIARPMSLVGTVEGILAVIFFVICAYFLILLAKYSFSGRHKQAWKKVEMYVGLVFGLVAFGGSIPWMVYLWLTEDRKLWPVVLVCTPIYCGLVLVTVRVFRYRAKQIRSDVSLN